MQKRNNTSLNSPHRSGNTCISCMKSSFHWQITIFRKSCYQTAECGLKQGIDPSRVVVADNSAGAGWVGSLLLEAGVSKPVVKWHRLLSLQRGSSHQKARLAQIVELSQKPFRYQRLIIQRSQWVNEIKSRVNKMSGFNPFNWVISAIRVLKFTLSTAYALALFRNNPLRLLQYVPIPPQSVHVHI